MTPKRMAVSQGVFEGIHTGGNLPEEVVAHLVRVLRFKQGDPVEFTDGSGRLFSGLLKDNRPHWSLSEISSMQVFPAQDMELTLYSALIKPARWRWIVEKSVELGVAHLVPVISERVNFRANETALEKALQRWKRVARETCGQCRRTHITQIHPPLSLPDALEHSESSPQRFVGSPGSQISALNDLNRHQAGSKQALLVGPEGGLSSSEMAQILARGYVPVSLGPHLMRAETAVVALITWIQAHNRLQGTAIE